MESTLSECSSLFIHFNLPPRMVRSQHQHHKLLCRKCHTPVCVFVCELCGPGYSTCPCGFHSQGKMEGTRQSHSSARLPSVALPLIFTVYANASAVCSLPVVLAAGENKCCLLTAYSTFVSRAWLIYWHISFSSIRITAEPHSQSPKEIWLICLYAVTPHPSVLSMARFLFHHSVSLAVLHPNWTSCLFCSLVYTHRLFAHCFSHFD